MRVLGENYNRRGVQPGRIPPRSHRLRSAIYDWMDAPTRRQRLDDERAQSTQVATRGRTRIDELRARQERVRQVADGLDTIRRTGSRAVYRRIAAQRRHAQREAGERPNVGWRDVPSLLAKEVASLQRRDKALARQREGAGDTVAPRQWTPGALFPRTVEGGDQKRIDKRPSVGRVLKSLKHDADPHARTLGEALERPARAVTRPVGNAATDVGHFFQRNAGRVADKTVGKVTDAGAGGMRRLDDRWDTRQDQKEGLRDQRNADGHRWSRTRDGEVWHGRGEGPGQPGDTGRPDSGPDPRGGGPRQPDSQPPNATDQRDGPRWWEPKADPDQAPQQQPNADPADKRADQQRQQPDTRTKDAPEPGSGGAQSHTGRRAPAGLPTDRRLAEATDPIDRNTIWDGTPGPDRRDTPAPSASVPSVGGPSVKK